MTKKILIVSGSQDDINLMKEFNIDIVNKYNEADIKDGNISLILFTGGEDVTPELYGHKNLQSYNNIDRDDRESKIFRIGINIPKIGICRGSQFINVMSGGTMVQHLNGHGLGSNRYHEMETEDKEIFAVNSTHHQMSIPSPMSRSIAWSRTKLSQTYLWKDGEKDSSIIKKENEVIFHPHTKSLGFQYHPEWMPWNSKAVKYFYEKIKSYFGV